MTTVYKYRAHCFLLDFGSECLQRRKKELVRFRPQLQDERRRQNRFAAKQWASKLAESDKDSYYNHEKWLKDDKAPEKPIETTAESSFMSPIVSGASFLGREAKRETKSREVTRHVKIGRSTIECFLMTSRRPCWCPKTILWELNSFLMQTLPFVPINLHRCWPRE